jgi:hypothetical protein
MATLPAEVAEVIRSLSRLKQRLQKEACVELSRRHVPAIDVLLPSLAEDFNANGGGKRAAAVVSSTPSQLYKQLQYQTHRRIEVEEQADDICCYRACGCIHYLWFIRVGSGDPTIPARSLESWCREFPHDEAQQTSRTYINTIRDAFCEIANGLSRKQAKAVVANSRVDN